MSIVFKVSKQYKNHADILIHYLEGLISIDDVESYFSPLQPYDANGAIYNKEYSFIVYFYNKKFSVDRIDHLLPSSKLFNDPEDETITVSEEVLGHLLLLESGK